MKICISAETTVDLPKDLLEEWDIHTIPFTLILGDQTGYDGEVTPETLYEYVKKTNQLPRTSAINETEYEEYFRQLLNESISPSLPASPQAIPMLASRLRNSRAKSTSSTAVPFRPASPFKPNTPIGYPCRAKPRKRSSKRSATGSLTTKPPSPLNRSITYIKAAGAAPWP